MLGDGGRSQPKKFGQFADRAFAVNQLTDDQEPMLAGEGLEQLARSLAGGSHCHSVDLHIVAPQILRNDIDRRRPVADVS